MILNRTSLTARVSAGLWAIVPVTLWAQGIALNPNPSRVVGQVSTSVLTTRPNLVEGRELNAPYGAAVDTANGIIWVADTGNNRVLGWYNINTFSNGAQADFVLGQRNFTSSEGLGPGTTFTSGLNFPTGVAVDSSGNVFVADAGNNRVVRYPVPSQLPPGEPALADQVIGQPGLATRGANQGGLSERTLFANNGQAVFHMALIFDAQGNLWVSDPGNHRVLRYSAASVGTGAASNPAANLVIGQLDFRSVVTLPEDNDIRTRGRKNGMRNPSGIAFDAAGRLFVCDLLNRVLVYRPPFNNGMDAARIMGVRGPTPQGQPAPAPINEQSLGVYVGFRFAPPEGVFTIGNTPFVVDSAANRILRYDPFDQWPIEATQFSPSARAVIGQDVFSQTEVRPHRGLPEPTSATLAFPIHAVFAAGETFVVDTANNRVMAMPDISTGPQLSAGAPYAGRRVLGQVGFEYRSPNLIEGREFNDPSGIVVDTTSDPPRLYVSDSSNNRILGFADARRVRPGDRADIVIGQPDGFRSLVNFPYGIADQRDDASLSNPIGLAIDRSGNLWVADNGNSRVLRFPSPFAQQGAIRADVVLGQLNFNSRTTDATARTMAAPYGVALSQAGHVFVSDAAHSRVLMFEEPLQNGKAASRVFGQPDFSSIGSGNTDNRFNQPRGIAIDTDDRLYVADSRNNRVMLFAQAPSAGNDPQASFRLTREVSGPTSVHVSPVTGEIWVGGTTTALLRFGDFNQLLIGGDTAQFRMTVNPVNGITQDQFGALYLCDIANRVAIHFPGLNVVNGANFLPRAAPGMIATMRPLSERQIFTEQTADMGKNTPLPRELEDLQVLVDDRPAPLFLISPSQINFQMPMSAPRSGTVEVQVYKPSQGRIVAASLVRMDVASPALLTVSGNPSGSVIAVNEDGSENSRTSAAGRGQTVTFFATGQGFVPDAPPDGEAPSGEIKTPNLPRVFAGGTTFLPDSAILYSGLAPGLVGVWQIKVKIPDLVPPGETRVVIVLNDIPSNDGGRLNHTFFVRP